MKYLTPFPSAKRPLVFAHRGAPVLAPENTIASFKLARELGARAIELDIHRCASGELVVFHDDGLERVTGAQGAVAESTLPFMKSLGPVNWKGTKFAEERIPTLRETFAALGDSVIYDIEIKSRTKERTGVEKQLSDIIDEFQLGQHVCVSSFNPFPLLYLKEIRLDIPTAIIWCTSTELPLVLRTGAGVWISGCDFLKPDYTIMNGFNILRLGMGRRRAVMPWTVDDPETARKLVDRGCSGFVTNRIQDMRSFL
jgi:glycerophosphoryl diester phosphodiesterase